MLVDISYRNIVKQVWTRHKALFPMDGYFSLVSLHGMARLAEITKDAAVMAEMKQLARPFLAGKVENMHGAYGKTVYRFGGNFTAFLAVRGQLSGVDLDVLVKSGDLLCQIQDRAANGAFSMPGRSDFHWIDTVFGVCPFLLWVGKTANRPDFIDEACRQMVLHHEMLFDPKRKLYFQAVNAKGDGKLTPAHWSRGVGWGIYALTELADELPKQHTGLPDVLKMYNAVMEGCLATQDADGMWHQAMESQETYAETSGTALIAYGMARGIKNGSLNAEKYRPAFVKAIKGLTRYIALDGSVFNCCIGCLAPGKAGSVEDYANHPWKINDPHAFGPIILAFGEAQHLQPLGEIPPLGELL